MSDVATLAACTKEIGIAIAKADASGEKTTGWEHIQELLVSANLAYRSRVPPQFVGVHQGNRITIHGRHHSFYLSHMHETWRLDMNHVVVTFACMHIHSFDM